jgi:hypothetical protein
MKYALLEAYTAQELTVWKLERLIEQKQKDGFLTASDEKELERCIFLLNHWGIEHPLLAKALKNQEDTHKNNEPSDEEILKTLRKI